MRIDASACTWPGPKAAFQHQLNRLRQAGFGLLPDFLLGRRLRPRVVAVAGLDQQMQVRIHHGHILRTQSRHAGGDEVDHRLDRLRRQRLPTGDRQHHAGLGMLAVMRERLPPRQHQMDAGMGDAMHRDDRAGKLAFQRAGKLHLLVEVGHRQVVAAVEDLVSGDAPPVTGRWR